MSVFDTPLGPIGAPTAVLDRAAFTRNLTALRDVAAPVPLRIATKSIRVRALIEEALRHDGVSGLLAYSVAEARWLVSHGLRDVLVAYPSTDAAAMRARSRVSGMRPKAAPRLSAMFFGFRERELVLSIFETITGLRMNHAYIRPGGVAADLPDEAIPQIRELLRTLPKQLASMSSMLSPVFSSAYLVAGMGAESIITGSSPRTDM